MDPYLSRTSQFDLLSRLCDSLFHEPLYLSCRGGLLASRDLFDRLVVEMTQFEAVSNIFPFPEIFEHLVEAIGGGFQGFDFGVGRVGEQLIQASGSGF